jgi:hypothetical protein
MFQLLQGVFDTALAAIRFHQAATKSSLDTILWYKLNRFWMLFHSVSVDLTPLYQLWQPHKYCSASELTPACDLGADPPRNPLPPRASQGTHPKPHPRLWKQTPATPQVSLPGILGMIVLLSTILQDTHPRIQHTYRSSPQSPVAYGLRWLLALHDKAMATAWDLITQTHLELCG